MPSSAEAAIAMTAARGGAGSDALGARLVALSAEADALPLSQLSRACQEIEAGLDALVSSRNVGALAAADALLRRCVEATDRSGVFSANESAEDLATTSLSLLLPPFVRGQLLCSSPASSAPQRLAMVQAAIQAHSIFLRRLEQYGLLGDVASRQYADEEEEGGTSASSAPASNPSMRRQAKIERFKAEKQLAAQLQQLQQRRAPLGVDEDLGAERESELGGPSGLDEEEERAAWLLRLQSAALKALEQRASLREERQLLAQAGAAAAEAEAQDPRQRRQQQQQEQQQRDMVMSGLRSIAAQLASSGGGGGAAAGPGAGERAMAAAHAAALGSQGERERLREGVFRPSHNLPTMSVEEFGRLELADAMERDKAEKAAHAERAAAQAAAGDPDYDDAEVERQRERDDFNDSNPRGWGNSALRPCGR